MAMNEKIDYEKAKECIYEFFSTQSYEKIMEVLDAVINKSEKSDDLTHKKG